MALHQFGEVSEQMITIMRSGGSFWMTLYREDRTVSVLEAFDTSVIEIVARNLQHGRQRLASDSPSVIL